MRIEKNLRATVEPCNIYGEKIKGTKIARLTTLNGRLLAHIWFRQNGKLVTILYMETEKDVRGAGTMLMLWQWLLSTQRWTKVVTPCASKSGRKWLLRQGFKFNDENADYEFTVKH